MINRSSNYVHIYIYIYIYMCVFIASNACDMQSLVLRRVYELEKSYSCFYIKTKLIICVDHID